MKLVCPVATITDSMGRVKDEDVWQHKMVCLLKLRDLGQPTSAPTLISREVAGEQTLTKITGMPAYRVEKNCPKLLVIAF